MCGDEKNPPADPADEPWGLEDATKFLVISNILPFNGAHEGGAAAVLENHYSHPPHKPRVHIRLGSIHSVKGETHTTTLVLDSFFTSIT